MTNYNEGLRVVRSIEEHKRDGEIFSFLFGGKLKIHSYCLFYRDISDSLNRVLCAGGGVSPRCLDFIRCGSNMA